MAKKKKEERDEVNHGVISLPQQVFEGGVEQ